MNLFCNDDFAENLTDEIQNSYKLLQKNEPPMIFCELCTRKVTDTISMKIHKQNPVQTQRSGLFSLSITL